MILFSKMMRDSVYSDDSSIILIPPDNQLEFDDDDVDVDADVDDDVEYRTMQCIVPTRRN